MCPGVYTVDQTRPWVGARGTSALRAHGRKSHRRGVVSFVRHVCRLPDLSTDGEGNRCVSSGVDIGAVFVVVNVKCEKYGYYVQLSLSHCLRSGLVCTCV